MKRILMFGKFNEITKDLNAYFLRYFQVQLCSDNIEIAKGMLQVYNPDLVIINLVGLYEIHCGFMNELYEKYREVPVVTIGTEKDKAIFKAYYEDDQFQNLIRPVDNAIVMSTVCQKLCLDMKTIVKEYERKKDKRKHILMVDDNAELLRSMKMMFQETYKISLAVSATQAMTIMGKNKPDLVILDYDMPICDGKMMLQMIRAEEKLKDVPVIFLTGVSDKEHVLDVMDLNLAGYFLKPPVYEQIAEAIDKLLNE